jgi:NAD(P)-dependent dehydrogenase (short-subunit alcohol dehydrogenase family)
MLASQLSRRVFSLPLAAQQAASFSTSQQLSSDGRLADKVSIITGGASGIGLATCQVFAKHGSKVAVVDLAGDGAKAVADEINAAGGEAIAIQADVSKVLSLPFLSPFFFPATSFSLDAQDADMRAIFEQTESKFGKVNVVFNNAGISHANDDDAVNTTEDVWDLTMDINVKGVFLGCKYAVPALKRAGGGSIINTASFVACLGAATPQLAYTSSKGAVLAMSRELAVIHARENIRVNALCPGPLNTELLQKYLNTPERRNRRLIQIPMGRFGEAEEIGLFLQFFFFPFPC